MDKIITIIDNGTALPPTTGDYEGEVKKYVQLRRAAGAKIDIQELTVDAVNQLSGRLDYVFAQPKLVLAANLESLAAIQTITSDEWQAESGKRLVAYANVKKAIEEKMKGQKSLLNKLHKCVTTFENMLLSPCNAEADRIKRLRGNYEAEKRRLDAERVARELVEARRKEEEERALLEAQKTPETEQIIEDLKLKVHVPVQPVQKEKGFRTYWELSIPDRKQLRAHLFVTAPEMLIIDEPALKRYLESQSFEGEWNGAKMTKVLK